MQDYKKIAITKEQLVPTAQALRDRGVALAMIHGHINDQGLPCISYEFEVPGGIESYFIEGEWTLPSLGGIYDQGAEWPEREITELMGMCFEGLDSSKRLFLPDTMLDGQGQIIVTPMDELKAKAHGTGKEDRK